MPSFRSALLFAAAAFAAFTSAAPTASDNVAVVAGRDNHIQAVGRQVVDADVDADVLGLITVDVDLDVAVLKRGECTTCKTLPGVFVYADVKIDALTKKCQETIAKGSITVDVAVKLVAEVKALVLEITAYVALLVNINLLNIAACITAIVNVVVKVILCLNVIVKACIDVKIDVNVAGILALVADVVALVVALLDAIIKACVIIKVDLAAKVLVAVQALVDLKIDVTAIVNACVTIKA